MQKLYNAKKQRVVKTAVVIAFAVAGMSFPALLTEAKEKYMTAYDNDPRSKPEYRTNCSVCHVSKQGSGERTYFGDAFEENNYKITQSLRDKYPKFFN